MAREDCGICRGTGWKMVARKDGLPGQVAAPCECGMEERAGKVMERARIPKRYEHCDFESYSTDLTDGKTWTAQHEKSLKHAKFETEGFVRELSCDGKRIVAYWAVGRGENAFGGGGVEGTDQAGARRFILRLPGIA